MLSSYGFCKKPAVPPKMQGASQSQGTNSSHGSKESEDHPSSENEIGSIEDENLGSNYDDYNDINEDEDDENSNYDARSDLDGS